jgi:uracil DNA glycosylase
MSITLQANYALTQPILAVKKAHVVDLLLTFRAERHDEASGPGPRLPLNLSLVIDRSGSMSGKPLKQAIAAAEVLLDQLEPRDTISVVVYDDRIDTVVEPQQVTDPARIRKAIRKVTARGSTNLHGGWLQGCKHVRERQGERLIHRVLLLTDGQANVGLTDPKKLVEAAREQAGKGVLTTTLGFGRGFNEDLLIGMAEASGGNFYFIETPEDASQVFMIEGETLTSIAAQELTVTLTPAPESGVKVREVLNHYPARNVSDGLVVTVGDVYSAEDKLVAVELEIPPQARVKKEFGLLDVSFGYDPVTAEEGKGSSAKRTLGRRLEGRLAVSAPVGKEDEAAASAAHLDVLSAVARIRIARAKERAVALADDREHAEAAAGLRHLVEDLRQKGLDEEFEIAEEIAQLEYFADTIENNRLGADERKVLRDQSYQARTRNRADLSARGSTGGSAASLPATDSPEGGVELACVREGGKLRIQVVSAGYEPDFNVQFPRGVREEGAHYVVDRLETSKNGTFYRAVGNIRRLTKPSKAAAAAGPGADPADPLALTELFAGGGEPWLPLLKPVIEAQPSADAFIGPKRDQNIVPVRELTFQALKPNPPEKWKVVIFGQNPYPRVESATGIAMFDNTFGNWKDSQFGKVTSIRCIIKAATMWKHRIPKATPIADIRALLAKEQTVQPPEWFQAMLTQGVLLLNAALTASSDGAMSTDQHTAFWRPVVERLVEEIFKAKQGADEKHRGVVFGWWGAHARALRRVVEKLQKSYPTVATKHIDHPNPAAQGDIFCDGNHFGEINKALKALDMDEVDWLPSVGWNKGAADEDHAGRMGEFISKTMELHKFYLERLAEVLEEAQEALPVIVGVLDTPLMPFADAVGPLVPEVAGLDHYLKRSHEYGQQNASSSAAGGLIADEIAAVYLYTTESVFYRKLNGALRDPDRAKVKPFFGYLRLLMSALAKLKGYTGSLWRGVAADLRGQYPKGRTVTWWGVSSCTAKRSVAASFIGSSGKRTLFEVIPAQAVSIRRYSAFTGEDEYLLLPGTQLKVADLKNESGGLWTIKLEELAGQRLVS